MSADPYQSIQERIRLVKSGDQQAREAFILENIGLVKFIVKRFAGRGAEYEDLFQYGCLGLLKAVDRFDTGYSVQFSTYAVPVILGEIRRYLRDDGPVHISRTLQDRARRVEEYVRAYVQENMRQPRVEEIAEALGLDGGDVLLAMNVRSGVRSLNEPVGSDGELRLMDVLGREMMEGVDSRLTLAKLLRDLSPEDRMLIVRRYFRQHTQARIAEDMGISQVQVSRMERRILNHMREMAESQTL